MRRKRNSTVHQENNRLHFTELTFEEKIIAIQEDFHETEDLKIRRFVKNQKNGCLIYFSSLVDKKSIQEEVLRPLLSSTDEDPEKSLLSVEIQQTSKRGTTRELLLNGWCAIFFDGTDPVTLANVKHTNERSITEPLSEKVIKGEHSGFVENLDTNLNLIRNRLPNPNLFVKQLRVGSQSHTKLSIVYIEGLANKDTIQTIITKIDQSKLETIENSTQFIEELLDHSLISPFPQFLQTERPDRVVANISKGKIAILVDNNPYVLILPVTFFSFYQSPDDYNSGWMIGSFFRLIRYFSFLVAIALPGFYIAVISFHYEIIPTGLAITIKDSVENIPYPPIVEAMIMEITLELLRESSIRLPNPISHTIGIVGGLVIGDAIVRAGLVSNVMIIVVALTAISSFVVPSYEMSNAIRIIRFPIMIMAALFGFLGITFSFIFILINLCRKETFHTPYLTSFESINLKSIKDTIFRLPFFRSKNKKSKY